MCNPISKLKLATASNRIAYACVNTYSKLIISHHDGGERHGLNLHADYRLAGSWPLYYKVCWGPKKSSSVFHWKEFHLCSILNTAHSTYDMDHVTQIVFTQINWIYIINNKLISSRFMSAPHLSQCLSTVLLPRSAFLWQSRNLLIISVRGPSMATVKTKCTIWLNSGLPLGILYDCFHGCLTTVMRTTRHSKWQHEFFLVASATQLLHNIVIKFERSR